MSRASFGFAAVAAVVALASGCSGSPSDNTGDDQEDLRKATFVKAEGQLFNLFSGGPQRGGQSYKVASVSPIKDALVSYVTQTEDPSDVSAYTYDLKATGFNNDTQEVGIISSDTAWAAIDNDLDQNIPSSDQDSKKLDAAQAKAKTAFDALVKAGAIFGYDGSEQSGCAAPTDFLLVIDPKAKVVFTIELTPCDQG